MHHAGLVGGREEIVCYPRYPQRLRWLNTPVCSQICPVICKLDSLSCITVLDDYVVDATAYLSEHVRSLQYIIRC